MPRIEDDEIEKYARPGKSDHYGSPFYPEDDRYEPEAWEQMTNHLWSHRRARKATKKQRSPRARLDGLALTLPGKLVLGYLGIGAAWAAYRAVKQFSELPAEAGGSAPGYYGPIATGALLDLVAWPYSVYQWATTKEPAPVPLTIAPPKVNVIGANRYGDTQRLPTRDFLKLT